MKRKQFFIQNVPGLWFVEFNKKYKKPLVVKYNDKVPPLTKSSTNLKIVDNYNDAFKYYKALKIACIKNNWSFSSITIDEYHIVPYYSSKCGFSTRRFLYQTHSKL